MSDSSIGNEISGIPALTRANTRDLKRAAELLGGEAARFLVDHYYTIQDDRIRALHQEKSIRETENEPTELLRWLLASFKQLETQIKYTMLMYAKTDPVSIWVMSLHGFGPVIAAGLLAHIDIDRAPTAGNVHSFAGLTQNPWVSSDEAKAIFRKVRGGAKKITEPMVVEMALRAGKRPEKLVIQARTKAGRYTETSVTGALSKRPYNARLRTLSWKIGQSILRTHKSPKQFYAPFYLRRKAVELARNLEGEHAVTARQLLADKKYKQNATKAHLEGRCEELSEEWRGGCTVAPGVQHLSPLHIDARARRHVVKLFLSHYHHVAHVYRFGTEPPVPYVFAHGEGEHAHYVPPPNFEVRGEKQEPSEGDPEDV